MKTIHTWRLSLAFVLCLLLPLGLVAQVTLRGRVLDEKKEALSHANVRLLTPEGKMQGGQATDAQGNYRISGLPKGTYSLEISYVGYKTHKEVVKLSESNQRHKDVILGEAGELSELMVTAKATEVAVRGDTIEYNAGSYQTSEGSAIIELIKKLPGAQVDDQGNVTVNGKSISQIMVDGKRFFDSDPKVALKNLPAELVDKVQVLSRESDNARMTGFADGDEETVINLSIKPGRKRGLFGTGFVGAGTEKRYEASAMLNRFSDTKQWTVLGGLNNTNNAGFSDIASDLSRSDLAQQASGTGRRPWERNNGNDGITISRILGGNMILIPSKKFQIGGNAFLGNSDKSVQTKSETTNIQSTGNTRDQGQTSENNQKWNFGTNLRMEWKPDSLTEIIVSPRLSFGTGKGLYTSSSTSSFEASGALISEGSLKQETESRVYNTRIDADISRKLNARGRTIALSLEGRLSGNQADGYYQSQTFIHGTGTNHNKDQFLAQDEKGQELRLRLNYVEPLTKSLFLQLNYQFRGQFSQTEREVHDFDPLTNGYNTLNTSSSYELNSNFYSHRAGLALKRLVGALDLTAGLNVDPSKLVTTRTYSTQPERVIRQSVTNFSPTFRLNYKPSRAFNLRLDYRGMSFQPSANQLSPINDETNPLVVYVGNENLRPGFRHNLFGSMGMFWAKKQSSLNLFFHGNITENNIVSKSSYNTTTGVRTFGYENVNGNWMAGLGGFYTTPIFGKRFSLRIGTRNNYAHSVGFSNGERNLAKTLNLSEELTIAYRYGNIDTSLKGLWSISRVKNSLSNLLSSTTQDYGLHWDSNIQLPLNLQLESQVRHTQTTGYAEGFNFGQTLVNVGLSYSFLKNKAATIRLKVYDLLAEQRNVFRSVSALAITSQETNIIGRYAMLHFIYKFNSFSGNASASDMRDEPGARRGPRF